MPPGPGANASASAYTAHLRAVTSSQGRPYAERTIGAYLDAVINRSDP